MFGLFQQCGCQLPGLIYELVVLLLAAEQKRFVGVVAARQAWCDFRHAHEYFQLDCVLNLPLLGFAPWLAEFAVAFAAPVVREHAE